MKLEEILEAAICAFGQTIFDTFSLEEDEFMRNLDYYINDHNYEEMLEEYAYQFDYDTYDIQFKASIRAYKNKDWDYIEIMNGCRSAYSKTIEEDKTIDAEALIDNIMKKLKK